MKRKRPGFWLAWVDMLMAQLATFAALFILSAFLINPPAPKKEGVEQKAEFLVTLNWPNGNFDDIDLHMLMPDGRMVNFRSRQQGYVLLDQDDMGTNGTYVGTDGQQHVLDGAHQEVITLRAIVPGTYTVNVHVYRVTKQWGVLDSKPQLPYPVKVTLVKINPVVSTIGIVDVLLEKVGQQKTAFSFTVLENGEVTLDNHADTPFIPVANEPS